MSKFINDYDMMIFFKRKTNAIQYNKKMENEYFLDEFPSVFIIMKS